MEWLRGSYSSLYRAVTAGPHSCLSLEPNGPVNDSTPRSEHVFVALTTAQRGAASGLAPLNFTLALGTV